MVTKVLNIEVRDGELDELNNDLKSVRGNMDNVDSSSKNAAKSMEEVGKNGGLISTLDAFTGGLATRIRDAAEATKVFNFNLKATRTALIATGIGAFVVALGTVLAYWEEIEEAITHANARLEAQIGMSENLQKQTSQELEILKLKQELLEAEGESTAEIIEQKKQLIELLLVETQNEINLLEIQYQRIQNQIQEITLWERLKAAIKGDTAGISLIGGNAEEGERIAEVMEKLNDARKRALELQIQEANLNSTKEGDAVRGPDQEQLTLPTTGVTLTQLEELGQQEFDALALQQAARTRLEEANSDLRRQIAEEEAQAKMMLYEQTANAFAAASNLVGQQTAAGKAFAVAASIISTYAAIAKTLEAYAGVPVPGYAIAQSIAIGAAGFASVKNIISTKVPGGYGSGSNPGLATSTPPAFNVVATSPQNQLNQALLEQNREPLEAFVVEGKVSTAEQLRRGKINASSIG